MIVVKLGGAALRESLESPQLFQALAQCSQPLVLVHGGGPEINRLCEKLGLTFEFVRGQRKTTAEVMEVVEMVLSGKINPALVRGLHRAGACAGGLSGVDLNLFECVPEDPALGLVGRVVKTRGDVLQDWLARKIIPVISPVGCFADGRVCNVNADLAVAQLAVDLKATQLLFLTDREGILDAQGALLKKLSLEELEHLADSQVVSGGMQVKARAIRDVLQQHPSCAVHVMNGLNPETLKQALAGQLQGTHIG